MSVFGGRKSTEPAAPSGGLSIIAVGMTVRGDIESNGTVKVEGTVEGHVEARDQVLVARGGAVLGDILARETIVGGAVHGSVHASDRVEIQAGAVVNGDIVTKRIAVAEGGSLNGQIRMSEAATEARTAGAERPAAVKAESRPSQSSPATPVPIPGRASVPIARVAVPPRLPASP